VTLEVLLLFAGLLVVAILVEPAARRLHLPFTAALIVVGFLGSEAYVTFIGDTGLRWYHFHDLVLHVFLPVLVFQSAFSLDARTLLHNLPVVLYLAVPLMVVATLVTAALLYVGIGHPAGFPWISALVAGTLLSATDPVAVIALFQRLGAPERLKVLLEGESLFNDAAAIVLFSMFVAVAAGEGGEASGLGAGAVRFLVVFTGGLAAGAAVGLVATVLLRAAAGEIARVVLTLVTALFAFWLAEHRLEVSGVVAVLAAGLVTGEAYRRHCPRELAGDTWALAAYVANALIFLLTGVTVTVAMFEDRWLAMLIGIGAVIVARGLLAFALLPPFTRLPGIRPVPLAERTVLFWGSLRGAVTLALALALPLDVEAWYTIQSIAYGVALFTLFVQAPTMVLLLRRLAITEGVREHPSSA